jgi:hypothetical protein
MMPMKIGDLELAEYADSVYERLKPCFVDLDDNPLEAGTAALNGKIAETRLHINFVQRIMLDIATGQATRQRVLRILEAEYAARFSDLVTTNPVVRAGRDSKEREAIARNFLRETIEGIEGAKNDIAELSLLHSTVKVIHSNLKDTEQRLKDQVALCIQEVRNNSGQWGISDTTSGLIDGEVIRTTAAATRGRKTQHKYFQTEAPPVTLESLDEALANVVNKQNTSNHPVNQTGTESTASGAPAHTMNIDAMLEGL